MTVSPGVDVVRVPAPPLGCIEQRPQHVGELTRWDLRLPQGGGITVCLGIRDTGPWVRVMTGPGGPALLGPDQDDLAALGRATTALATAHAWLATWREQAPAPAVEQPTLFEEATDGR